jgi:hypothetical protein
MHTLSWATREEKPCYHQQINLALCILTSLMLSMWVCRRWAFHNFLHACQTRSIDENQDVMVMVCGLTITCFVVFLYLFRIDVIVFFKRTLCSSKPWYCNNSLKLLLNDTLVIYRLLQSDIWTLSLIYHEVYVYSGMIYVGLHIKLFGNVFNILDDKQYLCWFSAHWRNCEARQEPP